MPKKKKSRKTTQSQRQSQKVIVNIGTATKRKRGGGGGGHRQNLAPTFITAPQVDFTPLLAMMSYQTRSLQPEPIRNSVTPLSSVTQVLPAEQMAGEAAIRRAGPTAGSFEPVSAMDREVSAGTQATDALAAILQAQMGVKPEPSSRSSSVEQSEISSMASTQIILPEGTASISAIKQMGAAEQRGKTEREEKVLAEKRISQFQLRGIAQLARIGIANRELESRPLEGRRSLTDEEKNLYRRGLSRSGINLTQLSPTAQQRTRIQREKSGGGKAV